jgi:hypothetical protein
VYSKKSMFRTVPVSVKLVRPGTTAAGTAAATAAAAAAGTTAAAAGHNSLSPSTAAALTLLHSTASGMGTLINFGKGKVN